MEQIEQELIQRFPLLFLNFTPRTLNHDKFNSLQEMKLPKEFLHKRNFKPNNT